MGKRSLLTFLAMVAIRMAASGQENLQGVDLPKNKPLVAAPHAADSRAYFPPPRFAPIIVLDPANTSQTRPDREIQPVAKSDGPIAVHLVPTSKQAVRERAGPDAEKIERPVAGPEMTVDAPRATAGTSERFWAKAEYGFWSLRGSSLPPLVTLSPAGTALENAGVLGRPTTRILIGDELANGDARAGGRFTIGAWLNQEQTWGLEAGFWFLEGQQHRWVAGSDGSQIIARPFTDAQTGAAAAELVSFPGLVAGSATVAARSDPLYGANLLVRKSLCCACDGRLDLLAGYRFLRFDESLQIQENLTSQEPATLGANIIVTDHFATRNEFHGGELGLQAEYWRGKFSLQLLGKLAVGNLHRQVQVDGSTVVTVAGFTPVVGSGGLLSLSSNSGNFVSNKLAWIPEIGITLGWQITPRLRATLGYTFLWWPGLVRPGDQIDPVINPSLLPPPSPSGPARPAFVLHDSDLWIHGLRFGLEYRY